MAKDTAKIQFQQPVLLVGPADLDFGLFEQMMAKGYAVIAADGGANRLLKNQIMPLAIIGDLDSLEDREVLETQTRVIQIEEQDSTDFEKCLSHIDAPLFLAFGFTGKRFDHSLATLHSMARFQSTKKILLVGKEDISFVQCGDFTMSTIPGKPVSIFPLQPISFSHSHGLVYSLDNLRFELGKSIGTSNATNDTEFSVYPSKSHRNTPYLISLSIDFLETLIDKFFGNNSDS